jgi:hypothetical protein
LRSTTRPRFQRCAPSSKKTGGKREHADGKSDDMLFADFIALQMIKFKDRSRTRKRTFAASRPDSDLGWRKTLMIVLQCAYADKQRIAPSVSQNKPIRRASISTRTTISYILATIMMPLPLRAKRVLPSDIPSSATSLLTLPAS